MAPKEQRRGCWCLSPAPSGPPPVLGSGRRQGTTSAGRDAEPPGAQGDNRLLPVPDRGRGPGPSALQCAGLPEARGHPGAAQPVGEEDRAAQIGAGHTGPPWAPVAEMASPPPGTWTPVQGGGGYNLSTATLPVSLPSPSSPMALSATSGRGLCRVVTLSHRPASVVTASEASRGGRVPKLWRHLSLLILSPTAPETRGGKENGGESDPSPPLLGQGERLMCIDDGGWGNEWKWSGGRKGPVLEAVGPGRCQGSREGPLHHSLILSGGCSPALPRRPPSHPPPA